MSSRRKRRSSSLTKGAKGIISFFALVFAVGLLLYRLSYSVFTAFDESYWVGIRSISAALFPLSVAVYLGFIARMRVPSKDSRAPVINNFIVFLFWTMLLLGIDSRNTLERFPLEELLYSTTVAVMIWRYKYRDSFKTLLACCYGVLSGSLAAVILFGMNPIAL